MSLVIPAPRLIDRRYAGVQRDVRIVFFGTPLFAVPSLRRLHVDGWPIAVVVTAPDKPTGRRMLLTPSPIKTVAEELGLEVRTPATLKDEDFWREFSELRPDLCVVVAYGKIIPKRYLDIPRLGFVNVHPSLLPAYRGPSPIQSAILDGGTAGGVSIMQLDEDTDHGPVLAAEPWTIPSGFDYPMVEDELSRLGADLFARTLQGYTEGSVVPQPQDHSKATYTKKFTREDGRLDWSQDATQVRDRIRALAANPGTWTTWEGKTLNLFHAHLAGGPLPDTSPGSVFFHASSVAVSCGQGALVLETVQLEGARRMPAGDFARGRPTFVGSVLK